MKIEFYQKFKPTSYIEVSNGFKNCLIFEKKSKCTLYNFIDNEGIEFDKVYGVEDLPCEDHQVWLQDTHLHLYDLKCREFKKTLQYHDENAWCKNELCNKNFLVSTGQEFLYIQDFSSGELLCEDLYTNGAKLKVEDVYFVEYPKNLSSRGENYFRKVNYKLEQESFSKISFDQHGGYRLLGIIGSNAIYLCLNTDDFLFYNINGELIERIHFKKVKSSAMYFCIDQDILYTVSIESRFTYLRFYDEKGTLQTEHKFKFETDVFKRKRSHSTVLLALKYKDFLWVQNAAFKLSGEAFKLGFPENFDWECNSKISSNGSFFIATDYNERKDCYESYILGSFEPNLIHPDFSKSSEIIPK